MLKYDALQCYLRYLTKANRQIVIKDFVGFRNWLPELERVIQPYTRHATSYCCYVKSSIVGFHRCIDCVNILQRRCRTTSRPFWTTCIHGINELQIPIRANGIPVGVISLGNFRDPTHPIQTYLNKLNTHYLLDCDILEIAYNESTCNPPANIQTIITLGQFLAEYIANLCEPQLENNKILFSYDQLPNNSFERIHRYIACHFTDPDISVKQIAEACNYSASSVSHLFHEHMNINIRQHINLLRVTLAKKLLRNGESISSVALECGFNGSSYFSSTFHQITGLSPTEYQKLRIKEQGILKEERI